MKKLSKTIGIIILLFVVYLFSPIPCIHHYDPGISRGYSDFIVDPSFIAYHYPDEIESVKPFQREPGVFQILIRFKKGVSIAERKNIAENIMKDVRKVTSNNLSGIKNSFYKTKDDEDWTEAISVESAVKEYGVFRKIMVGGAYFVLTKKPRETVMCLRNPGVYFSHSFPTVLSVRAPFHLKNVESPVCDENLNMDCVISFFYPAEIIAFLPVNVTIEQEASLNRYGGIEEGAGIRISKWSPFP